MLRQSFGLSLLFLTVALPVRADEPPSCAAIRAAVEASLDAPLGFRLREPGGALTVREGDRRPVLCQLQMRATGQELESPAAPGFVPLALRVRQGLADLGFTETPYTTGLVADGPSGTVMAAERDGLVCRTTVAVSRLPPEAGGTSLYEGTLKPWERGYALDIDCFGARPEEGGPPYPPFEIIAPEAVAPDLKSHPEARRYRTMLRQGAERGAAFAGHLAVAEWGCGSGCQQFAFIDARNGRVIWGPQAEYGAAYRQDSRLFIVNPPENLPLDEHGSPIDVAARTQVYLWDGERLALLGGGASPR